MLTLLLERVLMAASQEAEGASSSSKASKKGKVGAKDSDEEGCELAEHVTLSSFFFFFVQKTCRLSL